MAINDYITCCKCDVKLIYDGGKDNNRQWWEERWGKEPEILCPDCEKKLEPVAWMDREGDLYKMPEIKGWAPPHTMLYTAAPKREWVGLTDEEIQGIFGRHTAFTGKTWAELYRECEAKLKEKNV